MNLLRVIFTLAFLATLLAAGTGCRDGSYGTVQTTNLQGDPSAVVDLANSRVTINEGSATSAHLQLVAKDGDLISGNFQVADPTTLGFATTVSDPQRYVFLGVKSGTTTLTITVNGAVVATIPATVVAPPAYTPPAAVVVTPPDDAGGGGEDSGGDAQTPEGGGGANPAPDAGNACATLAACCPTLSSLLQGDCNSVSGAGNETNCATSLSGLQATGSCK